MSGRKFFALCAVGLFLIAGIVLYLRTQPQDLSVPAPEFSGEGTGTVASVYDGDTLTLSSGQRVRVLGIDAPEMSPEQPCALAARDEVRALIPEGAEVSLTPDSEQGDRDQYDRLLRYVDVPGTGDLGGHLLMKGLARVYEEYPVAKTPEYLDLQAQAQQNKAGVWGQC